MVLAIAVFLAAIAAPVDPPVSAIPRMGVHELHSMLKSGDAIAIDVRGSVPYELGHIEGAVWLPFGLIGQRAGDLPKDKLIVAYCTCSKEQVSLEVLAELQRIGFSHVAALQGGYPAWLEAGLPTASNRVPPVIAADATEGVAVPVVDHGRGRGRLAPPAAVSCDRNRLTSYAGTVTRYRRSNGKTTIRIRTDEETTETVTLRHSSSDQVFRFYLVFGTPFTSRDWNRIEVRKGTLHPGMRAIAWVCEGGPTIVDWRPGEPSGSSE